MPAPGTSGKMPESRNTVTGVFCRMANTRVRMVRGITASRLAAAVPSPSMTHSSYTNQPMAPTSAQVGRLRRGQANRMAKLRVPVPASRNWPISSPIWELVREIMRPPPP